MVLSTSVGTDRSNGEPGHIKYFTCCYGAANHHRRSPKEQCMITKAELDRLHRAVPKDYYHRGIQRNIFQRIWHHGRFRLITNELHRLRLSGAVLDIGCHSGDLTNVIAAAGDTPTYGVDLSAQSINYARERFPAINFQCV